VQGEQVRFLLCDDAFVRSTCSADECEGRRHDEKCQETEKVGCEVFDIPRPLSDCTHLTFVPRSHST
jgi:hypothetical protein